MTDATFENIFALDLWFVQGRGPRYRQLARYMAGAIRSGLLERETQLPPERELANLADVSRVTVRKTIAELTSEGLIEPRRGAGSFILPDTPKLQQSLSSLVSFTEHMKSRGKLASSALLDRGLFAPSPQELMTLGLTTGDQVARIRRLRSADGVPMAIETSSLPQDILPDPTRVTVSLYDVLRQYGKAPTRAIQRVTAANLGNADAQLLNVNPGTSVLVIERTAYLRSGRPIEFTAGLYRPDLYDFVSELRLEG